MAENFFYTLTLGCKINQYETQAISESWERNGWIRTDNPESAALILVNSCAVTAHAVRDTRKTARQMRSKAENAQIIVAGCAAQVFPEEFANMPEIDRVIPQAEKHRLSSPQCPGNIHMRISDFFRARAPVRVQDGCTHHCTYCIVPSTRGKSVSRTPADVLLEIQELMRSGIQEISLCGINLRQYGRDLEPCLDFWDLLHFLHEHLQPEDKKLRVRLSSLEPSELGSKAMQTLGACSNFLCPHLHISLQSGSPEILKKMGRGHYRPEQLLDFSRELKKIWPVFGLGADILIGFPGEDDRLYLETRDMLRLLPLTYAHIFPYSPRPGTAAAEFPAQINPGEKKERCRQLNKEIQIKKLDFRKNLLKLPCVHPVLESTTRGTNEFFVPTRFESPLPENRIRKIMPAVPVSLENETIIARQRL